MEEENKENIKDSDQPTFAFIPEEEKNREKNEKIRTIKERKSEEGSNRKNEVGAKLFTKKKAEEKKRRRSADKDISIFQSSDTSTEKKKTKENILSEPKIRTTRINTNMSTSINWPGAKKDCDELARKDTHYIFTFGYTGSGKSTVLAALVLYLKMKYAAIPNPDDNEDGAKLVLKMVKQLKRGIFPKATNVDEVIEFDISFSTDGGEPINLTFIEMAGENLKSYDPSVDGLDILDAIDVYLNCPDISISFLLVGDYLKVTRKMPLDKEEDQDGLLNIFMSRLCRRSVDTSNVGLILSKFDDDYASKEKLQHVIENHMQETYAFLKSQHVESPIVFPFTIGEVNSDVLSEEEGAIKSIELGDCEPIVDWIINTLLPNEERSESWFKKFLGI